MARFARDFYLIWKAIMYLDFDIRGSLRSRKNQIWKAIVDIDFDIRGSLCSRNNLIWKAMVDLDSDKRGSLRSRKNLIWKAILDIDFRQTWLASLAKGSNLKSNELHYWLVIYGNFRYV